MAKFRDKDVFATSGNNYKLLPFSFRRLSDKKVVLVNFVGDSYLCDSLTLSQLHSGDLEYNSTEYIHLRSLHFLIDDETKIALELLGIKYRTRLSRIAEMTTLHIFVVTLRCEHSCPYCQVSRQSDNKVTYDMNHKTANEAIDFALQGPSKFMKFEFQGGESLLNFPMIKYIVETSLPKAAKANKVLSFVIATNLAILTDEIIEFCRKYKIQISTSLDGPRELHNSNRPRPGKDSHQRTVQGIKKLREELGVDNVSALMTTTDKSLSMPKAIVDEYIDNGLDGIFLRPLSPYGFAIKTKRYDLYNEEKWFNFYVEGMEYILDLNKAGLNFAEYYSATILKKILTYSDPGYVDLRSPAGIGIAGIVYNYDGKIFASDEGRMLYEMGNDTFHIGDLGKSTYKEVMTGDKLLDPIEESFSASAPSCNTCAYQLYCGADPVYHMATAGDFVGRKAESAFCYRNIQTIDYLMKKLSHQEDGKILRSWVT